MSNNPLKYTDPTGHKQVSDSYKNTNRDVECRQGDTSCNWMAKYKALEYLRANRNKGPDVCFACESTKDLKLPADYTLHNSQTNSSSVSSELDEIVQTVDFGVKTMHILDLVEDGIQWGRPAYRQIKYAIPLGGLEWGIDAGLQYYDDQSLNLNSADQVGRAIIRGVESAVIDGASTVVGASAAGALQVSVPVPVVSAGVGYVMGSYATSSILDNFATQKNPALFNWAGLGGP